MKVPPIDDFKNPCPPLNKVALVDDVVNEEETDDDEDDDVGTVTVSIVAAASFIHDCYNSGRNLLACGMTPYQAKIQFSKMTAGYENEDDDDDALLFSVVVLAVLPVVAVIGASLLFVLSALHVAKSKSHKAI